MTEQEAIKAFLDGSPFAVVGASLNRKKYGNKVLRAYLHDDRKVYVVHPIQTEIEGQPCYRTLADLPETVHGLSIITPPRITEQVVEKAAAADIKHIWMQPGAENEEAIRRAEQHGMNVIAGGPCLLVALRYFVED